MQKKNRHLRREDRGVIYRMNKAGKTQKEIAEAIGFSQSTVSKELRRNKGKRGYREKQANNLATKRKAAKRSRPKILIGELKATVEALLKTKYSPKQVSGYLSLQGIRISHETIYKHIKEDKDNGGALHKNLRINGKRRYRSRIKAKRKGKIPNRQGIELRPKMVNDRARYGDWEADLIEGKKGSGFILSLYERKSHYGKLMKLDSKTSAETETAIIFALKSYRVKTITYDNGLEFAGHEEVSKALKAEGYFCQPYHSWEKGGVENFNGLVRQYYPKGSSFKHITQESLKQVEDELNSRPRETLGFQKPINLKPEIAA